MINNQAEHLEKVISILDKELVELDGPAKVALLRTIAMYYENLTTAETTRLILVNAFKKL